MRRREIDLKSDRRLIEGETEYTCFCGSYFCIYLFLVSAPAISFSFFGLPSGSVLRHIPKRLSSSSPRHTIYLHRRK